MSHGPTQKVVVPEELESSLGFVITRVASLFKRELIRGLADYEMTPEQWQVFASLWWADKALTQVEICHLTLKDKPTVSRMIDLMCDRGWIEKKASSTDARATQISLTEMGTGLKREVPRKLGQHFAPLLSQLNKEEHETLLRLSKKLRKIFGDE